MLAELGRSGVEVLYSSERVPAQMRIESEPRAGTIREQADEILASKGLRLEQVAPGHLVVVRDPRAKPQKPTPGTAAVRDVDEQLEEVAIYASRYAFEGHGFAAPRSLSQREAEQSPGSRNDALRAAQTLPGVATGASSQPYIRGSMPEDVLVIFDHVTINDPFHLQSFQRLISAFDSSVIDRMDVYSGGYPVRYGLRSGGVIELTPRTVTRGREYGVDVGLQSVGLSTAGQADASPIDWLFTARGNMIDLRNRAIGSGSRQTKLLDLIGRVRWQPSDASTWIAGTLLLNDRIRLHDRVGDGIATGSSHDAHLWLIYEYQGGGPWQSRNVFDYALERQWHDAAIADLPNVDASLMEQRRFATWSWNGEWIRTGDRVRWDLGAGAFVTRGTNLYHSHSLFSPVVAQAFARPPEELRDSDVRPREIGESVFAAFRPQLMQRVDLELGVRMDAQHFTGQDSQYQWSPRLNLRVHLNPRVDAYGSIGRFTQPQRPDEWRLEEAQQRADPAQIGTQAILGLSGATVPGTQWRIELYSKRWHRVSPYFDNLLNAQSLTPSLAPDRVLISPQSSIATGAEFSVRRKFGRLEVWGGYDQAQVTDNILGQRVVRSWDQRWSTNAGIGWTGNRFSTLATVRAHEGWPRTPVNAPPSARNSRRWGTYFEADLRAAWLMPLRSGSLEFWTEITNAGDRANDCCARMGPSSQLSATSVAWQPREIDIGLSWRIRAGGD